MTTNKSYPTDLTDEQWQMIAPHFSKKVIIKDGISAEGEATMTKFTGTVHE